MKDNMRLMKDDYALISVIAVFYNVENYMRQCIDSIIKQTYSKLEIILVVDDVDNSSQNKCGEICDEYAQKDNRIIVVHKKHEGLIPARKAGLEIATGEYVGFVDGDDWIEPKFYEHMYDMLKEYNVSFVETGILDSSKSGEKTRKSKFAEGCYKDSDYDEYIMTRILNFSVEDFYQQGLTSYLWNKLFRVNLLRQCYEQVDYGGSSVLEDYVVTIPYAVNANSVYVSHECLYHYRVEYNSGKRTLNTIRKIYPMVNHVFNIIEDACKRTKYKEVITKQLPYFKVYILMLFCPWVFDNSSNIILTPYNGVSANEKIVLYGAGAVGIQFHSYLTSIIDEDNILWVDADYEVIDNKFGVKSPETIMISNYDKIIIAILRGGVVKEVKKWLANKGVEKEKICFIEDKYIKNPGLLLETIDNTQYL
jgi:glycosyltransferase involved in cell wall biosynthesis